mmetsp:Transcript_15402/g.49168  ORF Transcript_15402/g.49168 Transcript_15402/m.49168 type:complete len:204 (-) Transcript_15402:19-630(-)
MYKSVTIPYSASNARGCSLNSRRMASSFSKTSTRAGSINEASFSCCCSSLSASMSCTFCSRPTWWLKRGWISRSVLATEPSSRSNEVDTRMFLSVARFVITSLAMATVDTESLPSTSDPTAYSTPSTVPVNALRKLMRCVSSPMARAGTSGSVDLIQSCTCDSVKSPLTVMRFMGRAASSSVSAWTRWCRDSGRTGTVTICAV